MASSRLAQRKARRVALAGKEWFIRWPSVVEGTIKYCWILTIAIAPALENYSNAVIVDCASADLVFHFVSLVFFILALAQFLRASEPGIIGF